jgi:hypothetical protein
MLAQNPLNASLKRADPMLRFYRNSCFIFNACDLFTKVHYRRIKWMFRRASPYIVGPAKQTNQKG